MTLLSLVHSSFWIGFYADASFGGLVPVLVVVPFLVSEA
jgi:hypothetical protein